MTILTKIASASVQIDHDFVNGPESASQIVIRLYQDACAGSGPVCCSGLRLCAPSAKFFLGFVDRWRVGGGWGVGDPAVGVGAPAATGLLGHAGPKCPAAPGGRESPRDSRPPLGGASKSCDRAAHSLPPRREPDLAPCGPGSRFLADPDRNCPRQHAHSATISRTCQKALYKSSSACIRTHAQGRNLKFKQVFGSAHHRRSSPSIFLDRWRQEECGASTPWEKGGVSAAAATGLQFPTMQGRIALPASGGRESPPIRGRHWAAPPRVATAQRIRSRREANRISPHAPQEAIFWRIQAAVAPTSKCTFDHDLVNGLNDTFWRVLARFRPLEAGQASLFGHLAPFFGRSGRNRCKVGNNFVNRPKNTSQIVICLY